MATQAARNKSKFRRSSKWTSFRRKLKYIRRVDEITLKPLLPGFNVHHLDLNEQNYEDTSNLDHFACLNKRTHQFAHWIYSQYVKDPAILDRLRDLLERMKYINED